MLRTFRSLVQRCDITAQEGPILNRIFVRAAHARKTHDMIDKLKFSETEAYFGYDKSIQSMTSKLQFDYFQTAKFRKARLKIWLISGVALFLYFKYIRESSDVDTLFDVPGHVLTAECERKMIEKKIEDARKEGKSTALLEEELEYVDVKEKVIMKQLEK